MDLTHVTYVHVTNISEELLPQIPIETTEDDKSVTKRQSVFQVLPFALLNSCRQKRKQYSGEIFDYRFGKVVPFDKQLCDLVLAHHHFPR